MRSEQAKLKRLQRLEKVRAIAKQTAATEAARAEGTLTQLQELSERTIALAAEYAARTDVTDGAGLVRMGRFAVQLQGVSLTTHADVARARAIADQRQGELAAAERKRAAVEERAADQARQIAARRQYAVLSGRRKTGAQKTGTELD